MKNKQLFCKPIPNSVLFGLLDQICLKKEKFYVIDANSFRKMIFHNLHTTFIQTMLEYYHKSKQFYASREFTYNSFVNIIRQICKANKIAYTSNIKYCESDYNIEYYIYF